jgi:lysophospholipase L1-like esterase
LIGTEQVVLDVNKQYEAIARRQGVTWINLFPAFATPDGKLRPELTNDGLHVMGKGYLVWRDAIKQYVK